MAEVFVTHRHPPPPPQRPISSATSGSLQEELEPQEDDFLLQPRPFVHFDSFSPTANFSSPLFFDNYTTSFDFGWESQNPGTGDEYPDCLFYEEEDGEQVNLVADLVESREALLTEDLMWDFDSDRIEGADLEFGLGAELGSNFGMNFASDSEEFEVNAGFINNNDDDDDDDDDYVDSEHDGNDAGYDGFEVNNEFHVGENERDEFEWEEVSERLCFDERENLNSLIDRIEEISVSSEIPCDGVNAVLGDEGEEEDRNTSWEVLLAMNNLNMNFEFENLEQNNLDGREVPPIILPEDYVLTAEYDTLFDEVVDNENALNGCHPAAKSVVESLPLVVLTKEELEENYGEVVCAVCKDDVAVGEKLTRMPCCHLYHGDCILPWFKITNTCPVCRYELTTDDAEYERRRRRSERGGSSGTTAEVRYNFELLP